MAQLAPRLADPISSFRIRRIPHRIARQRAEDAARILADDPRVRLVMLFGSTADASRSSVRDIDLAILTDLELELWELLRLRAQLVEKAGAGIDLVPLNRAGIVLSWEVATSGCCLYAADRDIETDFITRAKMRYFDFKPFLEAQRASSRERMEIRARGLTPRLH